MDQGPRIMRVLDLSTKHLPEDLGSEGLSGVDGVIAYDLPYGWLLWVPSDEEEMNEARRRVDREEVLVVLEFARRHDCDYVLIDRDADVVDGLTFYEW